MRLFRRARDTKTSVIRREAVSTAIKAANMPSSSSSPVAPVVVDPLQAGTHPQPPTRDVDAQPSLPIYDAIEDSDVFLCDTASPASERPTVREVTLFVHGWHNVEPGLLSWTFPNLRAALDAVQRMKNAIGWCVVSGTSWPDLESARASGAVLVEQLN
jgi:hypothetical protein